MKTPWKLIGAMLIFWSAIGFGSCSIIKLLVYGEQDIYMLIWACFMLLVSLCLFLMIGPERDG